MSGWLSKDEAAAQPSLALVSRSLVTFGPLRIRNRSTLCVLLVQKMIVIFQAGS